MNINTADGMKELIEKSLENLIDKRPFIGQTDAGGGSVPVYLDGGLLKECSDIVAVSNYSSNGNGYIQFNNGLIIQWGWIGGVAAGTDITYPISFKSFSRPIATLHYGSATTSGTAYSVHLVSVNEAGFTIGNVTGSNVYAEWIAVGY